MRLFINQQEVPFLINELPSAVQWDFVNCCVFPEEGHQQFIRPLIRLILLYFHTERIGQQVLQRLFGGNLRIINHSTLILIICLDNIAVAQPQIWMVFVSDDALDPTAPYKIRPVILIDHAQTILGIDNFFRRTIFPLVITNIIFRDLRTLFGKAVYPLHSFIHSRNPF